MVIALFGCGSRTDAAHAALILADAHAALDLPVALVRASADGEAALPARRITERSLTFSEVRAATPAAAAARAAEEAAAAAEGGRTVVLDLPPGSLPGSGQDGGVDVGIAAVGPTALDEEAAVAALAGVTGGTAPWLLGCGRDGGDAAVRAFRRSMRHRAGDVEAARSLSAVMPSLSRRDADVLVAGDRNARTLAAGLRLVAAVRAAAAATGPTVDEAAFLAEVAALGERGRAPDVRRPGSRLHDLADDLLAIEDELLPTGAELDDAPRLDGWRIVTSGATALVGRVSGHPGIPDGRRVTTSDLYASDLRTWARTASRWYALGERDPTDPA